jgi:hypothetical protein
MASPVVGGASWLLRGKSPRLAGVVVPQVSTVIGGQFGITFTNRVPLKKSQAKRKGKV